MNDTGLLDIASFDGFLQFLAKRFAGYDHIPTELLHKNSLISGGSTLQIFTMQGPGGSPFLACFSIQVDPS